MRGMNRLYNWAAYELATLNRREAPVNAAGGACIPNVVPAPRESQSRTARRGHAAARLRADPRRRRQRQDARAHDAHRVAARDGPGEPARPCSR